MALPTPEVAQAALNQTARPEVVAIRKTMSENASATVTPAENFVNNTQTQEIPNKEATDAILGKNVGTDRDPSGRKIRPTTAETTRLAQETVNLNIVRTYLENPAAASPSTAVIRWADQVWSADAEMSAALPPPGAARDAAIAELLKDPELRSSIRDQFLDTVSEGNVLEDEVTPAQLAEADAKAKHKRLDDERIAKAAKLKVKQEHQDQYDDPKTKGVGKDLASLTARLPDIERDIDISERDMGSLDSQISPLAAKAERARLAGVPFPAADQATLDALRTDLAAAKKLHTTRIAERDRQAELAREKAALPSEIVAMQSELTTAEAEVNRAQTESLLATATREEMQLARKQAEEAYANKVKGIIGRGVTEYTKGKLEAAQDADAEIRQKKIDEAKTAGEKAVAEQERYRYVGPDGKPDKSRIDPDWAIYMDKTRGPKEVLGHMLGAQFIKDKNYNPFMLTPAQKKEVNDFVNERLADSEFVEAQIPGVAEALIAARLRSGAKLTEGEGYTILSNPETEGAIDAAIARNDKLKQKMNELKASGKMEEGMLEFLKRQSGPNLLKWLVFIFGTAGVGGLVLASQLS